MLGQSTDKLGQKMAKHGQIIRVWSTLIVRAHPGGLSVDPMPDAPATPYHGDSKPLKPRSIAAQSYGVLRTQSVTRY
jgi:hypothetical protein